MPGFLLFQRRGIHPLSPLVGEMSASADRGGSLTANSAPAASPPSVRQVGHLPHKGGEGTRRTKTLHRLSRIPHCGPPILPVVIDNSPLCDITEWMPGSSPGMTREVSFATARSHPGCCYSLFTIHHSLFAPLLHPPLPHPCHTHTTPAHRRLRRTHRGRAGGDAGSRTRNVRGKDRRRRKAVIRNGRRGHPCSIRFRQPASPRVHASVEAAIA
jgi:hypothetical protein